MKCSLMALCLLAFSTVRGQPGGMEAGGYVKSLTSRISNEGEAPHYDHLLHARLNTKWFPADDLSGALELRLRWYYGASVEQVPDFARQLGHDAGFGRLGAVLWETEQSVGYGEVDRLYVNWTPGRWQATVGRQRIAWGTNLVWNPIDVFNPFSVLDFDYEERPAADAVRVQYYTGEISKIELAVKPGNRTVKSITAAQWTSNEWDYDFHFLGGRRGNTWLAGTGWAGDIMGGGFRGEALVSEVPDELRLPESGRVMVSAALSVDYTFPSSFYIHAEALHNSQGVTENAALARPRAEMLGLLSPARWSLYQEFSYDVTPLVRAGGFTIYNPDDHSVVLSPSATWSIITNLDLTLLALLFSGAPLTEYGGLGTITYLRLKWSF
ncbi:hypothetical protein EHM92_05845 [bacterium]|nr:MAG: hypothetical protein EHM92_05845 [bacterium]